VKLGRDISMWPRMVDIEGERSLVEFAAPHRDSRGFPAKRVSSVGADYKPRGK
jgi:hypothetical protein